MTPRRLGLRSVIDANLAAFKSDQWWSARCRTITRQRVTVSSARSPCLTTIGGRFDWKTRYRTYTRVVNRPAGSRSGVAMADDDKLRTGASSKMTTRTDDGSGRRAFTWAFISIEPGATCIVVPFWLAPSVAAAIAKGGDYHLAIVEKQPGGQSSFDRRLGFCKNSLMQYLPNSPQIWRRSVSDRPTYYFGAFEVKF